jgi:octaprenyl-diphosphate synthase
MQHMSDFMTRVSAESAKIDTVMRRDLAAIKPESDGLLREVLHYGLFNGGKRLRPLLVVMASRLCGNDDEEVYRLGCAFEYLHAATLFHDDIIDNSELRRGKKSVYKQYGMTPAILAGDYLHALSMAIVGRVAGAKGLTIFCNATTGMVDGEFMQLRNAAKDNLAEPEYYRAIMMKTGLLIAAACEVGALYGGGTSEQVEALRGYGEHLGCAFQIIDDLLDYQGDPNRTGKALGNDLLEGKITLPLIFALENGGEKEKQKLQAILSTRKDRPSAISEVTEIIAGSGGFTAARAKAESEVASAIDCLRLFTDPAHSSERLVLEDLARYVLSREK